LKNLFPDFYPMLMEYGSTLDGAGLSDYCYHIKNERIILNYYSGRV